MLILLRPGKQVGLIGFGFDPYGFGQMSSCQKKDHFKWVAQPMTFTRSYKS